MRIVFMGTPEFAKTSLARLVEDGHDVCGVFTQPDKPGNRNKVKPSPVKEYALAHGIPVFQPVKMRDGTAAELLRSLRPELVVVAAYGRILPPEMLAAPPYGCINVHASLLPKYRGAAPINRAILNGERETGVTIMYLAEECDTGDMILAERCPIRPDENAEELFAELAILGADALSRAIGEIVRGTAKRVPQDHAQATYAPMLTRELSPVDPSRSAREIADQVRGLVPWPCATLTHEGKILKLYRAEPCGKCVDPCGTMRAGKAGITLSCGDGNGVLLTELQPEGGKRMAANAYLNGRRIAAGTVLLP